MRQRNLAIGFSVAVLISAVLILAVEANAQQQATIDGRPLRVIMIGAHPDDSEIKGGGTAALWAEAGAKVQIVAVANGDAGHQSQGGGALARRRAAESRRAAEILGVSWRTLDFHDGELVPSMEVRNAVIRAIREWQADIVISHRPYDYHPDHRYTGQVVQDAAYIVIVPGMCPDTPRLEKNPVFLYFSDRFRKPYPFTPNVVVGVDRVMDKKWAAIDAMTSQMYEWGPWLSGSLDQVPAAAAERLAWLEERMSGRFLRLKDNYRDLVTECYGKDAAAKMRYVEVFELCEYGRQPDSQELRDLFPK